MLSPCQTFASWSNHQLSCQDIPGQWPYICLLCHTKLLWGYPCCQQWLYIPYIYGRALKLTSMLPLLSEYLFLDRRYLEKCQRKRWAWVKSWTYQIHLNWAIFLTWTSYWHAQNLAIEGIVSCRNLPNLDGASTSKQKGEFHQMLTFRALMHYIINSYQQKIKNSIQFCLCTTCMLIPYDTSYNNH